jgi:RNA-directed DNA polymerase
MSGVPTPGSVSTKQARIAQLARQMPETAISSLSHHMDQAWLLEAHRRTRKDGATGIDRQTSEEYAANLSENLRSLEDRAKSGTYHAPAVRRVHIPKGDGKTTRPLGIPTYEDKVLQRAVMMVLEPIYEQDFYDCSYGFRPRRSAHHALEALMQGLSEMDGGWVLDVDVRSFFDELDHQKLRELLRQRVIDGVVVRLIGKWLRAGVLEGGVVHRTDQGTPQGGVISPLLANIYLHEVLDKWWMTEVLPRMTGRAFLVRYADDFVIVFSERQDALRVQKVLAKRFARFGLRLHPEKTRLVAFRRPPRNGGGPRSGSFDFLGFTHYWGRNRRQGQWSIRRKTAKSRFSRALKGINQWMRRWRHLPVKDQARVLGSKLRGHFNYYGLPGNARAINRFHYEVRCRWRKWLSRRSQRARLTWEKFNRLLKHHPLPPARLPPRPVQYRLAKL